jgi:hypothetical protein
MPRSFSMRGWHATRNAQDRVDRQRRRSRPPSRWEELQALVTAMQDAHQLAQETGDRSALHALLPPPRETTLQLWTLFGLWIVSTAIFVVTQLAIGG